MIALAALGCKNTAPETTRWLSHYLPISFFNAGSRQVNRSLPFSPSLLDAHQQIGS